MAQITALTFFRGQVSLWEYKVWLREVLTRRLCLDTWSSTGAVWGRCRAIGQGSAGQASMSSLLCSLFHVYFLNYQGVMRPRHTILPPWTLPSNHKSKEIHPHLHPFWQIFFQNNDEDDWSGEICKERPHDVRKTPHLVPLDISIASSGCRTF